MVEGLKAGAFEKKGENGNKGKESIYNNRLVSRNAILTVNDTFKFKTLY